MKMKRRWKAVVSVLLALILVVCNLTPVSLSAQETDELDLSKLTEITWEDFGMTCGETYGSTDIVRAASGLSNLNNTLFNGDVIISGEAEIRYGGGSDKWSGLKIKVNADETLTLAPVSNNTMSITNTTFQASTYGLKSFSEERFNLKIAMTNVTTTEATVNIWINDYKLCNEFTITGNDQYPLGNQIKIYSGEFTPCPMKTTTFPKLTEITWEDFGATAGETVSGDGPIRRADGLDSLNNTLFNGDIYFEGASQVRYGGLADKWAGLRLITNEDGTLSVGINVDNSLSLTTTTFQPKAYGLESFIGNRFNLKIAMTNVTEISADVNIWINDYKLCEEFTVTIVDDYKLGCDITVVEGSYTVYPVKTSDFPELKEITWEDFGMTCGETYGSTDIVRAASGLSNLNSTLFNGDVIISGEADIRYGGGSGQWSGLKIKVNADETLTLAPVGSNTMSITNTTFQASTYGLKSFSGERFNLKIAMTNVTTTEATVNIWINDYKLCNEFTITGNDLYPLGNQIKIVSGEFTPCPMKTDMSQETPETPEEPVEPELTEITWEDFDMVYGQDYGNGTAPVVKTATQFTDLNNTIFNGNVELASGAEFRYGGASNKYGGLKFIVKEDDTLSLVITGDGNSLDFTDTIDTTFQPSVCGLSSFIGTSINLKIAMTNVTATEATVNIWINNLKLCEEFEISISNTDFGLGNQITVMNKGAVIPRPMKTSTFPDLKKITWEDFGITGGQTYGSKATVRTAYHLGNLNDTLFDGNVIFNGASQIRYGGSSDGYAGMKIIIDGDTLTLAAVDQNSISLTNNIFQASNYGLNNFIGKEFNLKIAMTDVSTTKATVNIWINDYRLCEEFTITGNTNYPLGNTITVPNDTSNFTPYSSMTVAPDGLKEVLLTDWKSDVYEDDLWKLGEINGEANPTVSTLVGTTFKETLQFVGPAGSTTSDYVLCYGGTSAGNWNGICIALQEKNMVIYNNHNSMDTFTLLPDVAGVGTSFVDTEFTWQIDLVAHGKHALLYMYFEGNLYNNAPFVIYNMAEVITNKLVFYPNPNGGESYAILGASEQTLDDLYHDLSKGDYKLPSELTQLEKKSVVDGKTILSQMDTADLTSLSEAGDYRICYNDGESDYIQDVILYRTSDMTAAELVRALKHVQNKTDENWDGFETRMCDMDCNGTVEQADVTAVRQILLDTYQVENAKDVMPIVGHYGPIGNSVTDSMYAALKNAGINQITQYSNEYSDEPSNRYQVYQQLTLAQKYGIKLTVHDNRLTSNLTTVDGDMVLDKIKNYQDYQSFAGLYVVDEPYSNYYPTASNDRTVDKYAKLASAINGEGIFAYSNALTFSWKFGDNDQASYDYVRYLRDYVDRFDAKFLSFTYYPFWTYSKEQGWQGDSVETASQYFENLAMIRSVANQKKIDFRTFVQVGDGFESSTLSSNNPSEGEFKWNANIGLAFGAKGIQYFPCVQPNYFADAEGVTVSSGLIDQNGNKSEWYPYAVDVNKQVAAIDEVLMNAKNEGFMVTGSYATQATNKIRLMKLKEKVFWGWYKEVEELETEFHDAGYEGASVKSTDDTYGAFTGCFKYGDKHALYIVNYNVTENTTNTVTVDFGTTEKTATLIHNAVTKTETGTSMNVELAPGEAVLVVY